MTQTRDGLEACMSLSMAEFDFLLLDTNLPDHDGWETLQMIREFELDLPIYMLVDEDDESDLAKVKAKGAAGLIRRPFNLAGLEALTKDLIEQAA